MEQSPTRTRAICPTCSCSLSRLPLHCESCWRSISLTGMWPTSSCLTCTRRRHWKAPPRVGYLPTVSSRRSFSKALTASCLPCSLPRATSNLTSYGRYWAPRRRGAGRDAVSGLRAGLGPGARRRIRARRRGGRQPGPTTGSLSRRRRPRPSRPRQRDRFSEADGRRPTWTVHRAGLRPSGWLVRIMPSYGQPSA